MYELLINGKPFGKPKSKIEAEWLLNRLKYSVLGLEMRLVRHESR